MSYKRRPNTEIRPIPRNFDLPKYKETLRDSIHSVVIAREHIEQRETDLVDCIRQAAMSAKATKAMVKGKMPWWTPELSESRCKMRKDYKNRIKHPSVVNTEACKTARSSYKKELREARGNSFTKILKADPALVLRDLRVFRSPRMIFPEKIERDSGIATSTKATTFFPAKQSIVTSQITNIKIEVDSFLTGD